MPRRRKPRSSGGKSGKRAEGETQEGTRQAGAQDVGDGGREDEPEMIIERRGRLTQPTAPNAQTWALRRWIEELNQHQRQREQVMDQIQRQLEQVIEELAGLRADVRHELARPTPPEGLDAPDDHDHHS